MTRLNLISSARVYRPLTLAAILILIYLLTALHRTDASPNLVTFEYEFDRSELPTLNVTELTVLITVGDAQGIQVRDENRSTVPFTRLPADQQIMVTSNADLLQVELTGVTDFNNLGYLSKAKLKDNKLWAWSHSFDDNHFLEEAIGVMRKYDLPATMYIVGNWIDSGHTWDGDLTDQEIHDLLDAGWSIGNHTMEHDNNCGEQPTIAARRQSILQTEIALNQVIQASNRADYKVISLAVPCGGTDRFIAYHQILQGLKAEGKTDLLFSEGGHELPLHTNAAAPFDFDAQIKRDLAIDGEEDNSAEIMAIFDSASQGARSRSGEVVWYNSFSHGTRTFGNNAIKLELVASYFDRTYGKNGSNEAWMAPADEIYSYLLVRDLTVINTASPSPPIQPTSTQTPRPVITETPTSTATPAANLPIEPTATADFFATSTPLAPSGRGSGRLYLPAIMNNVSRSSER